MRAHAHQEGGVVRESKADPVGMWLMKVGDYLSARGKKQPNRTRHGTSDERVVSRTNHGRGRRIHRNLPYRDQPNLLEKSMRDK